MNQVHKEQLKTIENALPTRAAPDIEIFGMVGIPEDIVAQHNQRIIQQFYQSQADRQAATGNPPSGGGTGQPRKKIKIETAEELKKRFAEHRAKLQAIKAGGGSLNGAPGEDPHSNAQGNGHMVSAVLRAPHASGARLFGCFRFANPFPSLHSRTPLPPSIFLPRTQMRLTNTSLQERFHIKQHRASLAHRRRADLDPRVFQLALRERPPLGRHSVRRTAPRQCQVPALARSTS